MGSKTVRETGQSTREGNGQSENLDGGQVGGNKETISDSEYIFNPANFGTDSSTDKPGDSDTGNDGEYSQPKRKQRRGKQKKEATSNLTNILIQSHVMLAAFLDTEELLLNGEEANNLAKAIERVESLYEKSFISEEASAWIGLTIAAATIYGPRYMAVRARKQREAREKKSREAIDVQPLSSGFEGSTARPS
jgi:hypothetical protein